MSAGASSESEPRARAWFLIARFDLAEHPRLADADNDRIFPEYVRELLDKREKYRETRLKGLSLFTYSMPTSLSSMPDGQARDSVFMQGVYQGSHLVAERAVRGLFGSVRGLDENWGPLYFGQGESLNDHKEFKRFLCQSSLEGMDSTLLYRVDYRGVSEARQPTTAKEDVRARAWKFDAVLNPAHHTDLVHARGEFLWEYFHLHILQRITNWEKIKEAYDLISYSVQREIFSEHARGPLPVVGYFRHRSDNMRQKDVQSMLDGIPGLTVNWHAVRLGPGSRLASNTDYQAFLAASTKAEDGADSNQNLRIRVDVRGTSDAAPKKRGPATGSKQNRPALASLDSIMNSGAPDTA